MQFIISTTDEVLIPQAGLGLVGALLQDTRLRQRLDAMRDLCGPILREESALLVRKYARKPTPCHGQWVALDVDVSPFDNSNTKKEGVSWTYKKVDGFAPIFAYLGEEGYLVHCQLREGKQHCQEGTPQFLHEALEVCHQRDDAVAGFGGVQRVAAVWSRGAGRAAAAAGCG